MKVIEIMQRVGSKEESKVIGFIKDALDEIQGTYPDKTERWPIAVTSGVRWYSWPSDMIALKGVFRKYDEGDRYIRIPRLAHYNIMQYSTTSATAVAADDVAIF